MEHILADYFVHFLHFGIRSIGFDKDVGLFVKLKCRVARRSRVSYGALCAAQAQSYVQSRRTGEIQLSSAGQAEEGTSNVFAFEDRECHA